MHATGCFARRDRFTACKSYPVPLVACRSPLLLFSFHSSRSSRLARSLLVIVVKCTHDLLPRYKRQACLFVPVQCQWRPRDGRCAPASQLGLALTGPYRTAPVLHLPPSIERRTSSMFSLPPSPALKLNNLQLSPFPGASDCSPPWNSAAERSTVAASVDYCITAPLLAISLTSS